MNASSLMTREPLTVSAETRCDSALDVMDDADIRHLPVVDPSGALVGVVSDRDLLSMVGWPNRGPSPSPATGLPGMVRDCMAKDVSTVAPDDSLVTASVGMSVAHVGCLPVVEDGRLAGIVTEMDVAKAFWNACQDGRDADLDERVGAVMTVDPVTIAPDATLSEAARICREGRFRHLPVIHESRLLGVLSDRDLCTAFGNHRAASTAVAEIMAHAPITTTADTALSDAAEVMIGHRISSLPVLDGATLVGILTLTDILDHAMNRLHDMPDPAPER